MKDIVVYTSITQGYDTLKPPLALWRDEADFVAFLNKPLEISGWQYAQIHRGFSDPTRNAKIHKILPHRYFPGAKYSLWIDGSVRIASTLPLSAWITEYLANHDLAVFKHRSRHCIYQEADRCLELGLDSGEVIRKQIQKYRDEGYPENNGLAECSVLFRRHSPAMNLFNDHWNREIQAHSRRDQLSFNYVAHKLGLTFRYLPGNMGNNPHFIWLPHLAGRKTTNSPKPCNRSQ